MTLTDKQRIELSLLETYTKLADADPTFIETIKNTGLASAQFIVRHFEQFQSEFRWEDDEIGNVEISQILSAPPQRIYREQHCRNKHERGSIGTRESQPEIVERGIEKI